MPGTEIAEGEEKRELLRRISGGHSLEIWRMRLPAHHASDGVPHAPGTIEHLYVSTGYLTAGRKGDLVELGPVTCLLSLEMFPMNTGPVINQSISLSHLPLLLVNPFQWCRRFDSSPGPSLGCSIREGWVPSILPDLVFWAEVACVFGVWLKLEPAG